MSDAPKTAAEKLVAEALLGNDQIKGEPDNYFVHRDTFLATVERAINEEREACARVIESGRFLHDQAPTKLFATEAAAAIRRRTNN